MSPGDHALAYVRARRLEHQDTNGAWRTDPTSDLGRITRQQDFLRRTMAAVAAAGVTDMSVARSLLESVRNDIVLDSQLTISDMIDQF